MAVKQKATYRQRLKRIIVYSAGRGLIPISWAEWLLAAWGLRHD